VRSRTSLALFRIENKIAFYPCKPLAIRRRWRYTASQVVLAVGVPRLLLNPRGIMKKIDKIDLTRGKM